MKTVGLMTVRDEEDILKETGAAAANSYDMVLIVDCGSVDSSPAITRDLAGRFSNVFFLGSIAPLPPEMVKRHVWEAYRRKLTRHDWWIFADADELVARDDLRAVLDYATRRGDDHVYGEHVNFYYTEKDYEKWLRGEETLASRAQPIGERRRYYRYHTHQMRCFRNLPWLRWNADTAFPDNLSSLCERKIMFLHYQYRDVPQILNRIRIRKSELHRTHASNIHWDKATLADALSRSDDPTLQVFDGGEYVKDPSLPDLTRQGAVVSRLKYIRNALRGTLTKQEASDWFTIEV